MNVATPNPDQTLPPEAGEYIGTLSRKGTVTIPLAVRRRLKIKPKDKVIFRVQGQQAVIQPGPLSLEEVMGSIKPLQPGQNLEKVIAEAKEEHRLRRFKKKMSP